MNPLIYVGIGLGLGAIIATVYAVLSAEDGYEDQAGFHAIQPPPLERSATRSASDASRTRPDEGDSSLPPYLPVA